MKDTYGFPIMSSSSASVLHEEPISFQIGENRLKATVAGFYPVGTSQRYVLVEGTCGNDSYTIVGDQTWSTCEAPSSLAVIPENENSSIIRSSYWYFNYGLWTYQPPECSK